MDDITNKRFEALEAQIRNVKTELDQKIDGLAEGLAAHRKETAAMEIRLTTELHAVMGAIADIKSFLVDRDTTKKRLDALEREVMALRTAAGVP